MCRRLCLRDHLTHLKMHLIRQDEALFGQGADGVLQEPLTVVRISLQ